MIEFGNCLFNLCATDMWLSGESHVADVGVRTISAPRALKTITFSALIFSGKTIIVRYPFTAPANARPMPEMCIPEYYINGHLTGNSNVKMIFQILLRVSLMLPVFPDVGSIIVSPGLSKPFFSASSTILNPILSFTLPPALKNSHFATRIMNV